jgi:small multidrug resistance family-3 protein
MGIIKSFVLFVLAGLCAIGGGYLLWLRFRTDKLAWHGKLMTLNPTSTMLFWPL